MFEMAIILYGSSYNSVAAVAATPICRRPQGISLTSLVYSLRIPDAGWRRASQ